MFDRAVAAAQMVADAQAFYQFGWLLGRVETCPCAATRPAS